MASMTFGRYTLRFFHIPEEAVRLQHGVQDCICLMLPIDPVQEIGRHGTAHGTAVHLNEHRPFFVDHVFPVDHTVTVVDGIRHGKGIADQFFCTCFQTVHEFDIVINVSAFRRFLLPVSQQRIQAVLSPGRDCIHNVFRSPYPLLHQYLPVRPAK